LCGAEQQPWYNADMTAKALKDAIERAETWPEEAQEELAEIALQMDAGLCGDAYRATPDEVAGIDRGLRAAREGRFFTREEVEAVFAKHRRA
jgi:hypothetical protein